MSLVVVHSILLPTRAPDPCSLQRRNEGARRPTMTVSARVISSGGGPTPAVGVRSAGRRQPRLWATGQDGTVPALTELDWSDNVAETGWIAKGLSPSGETIAVHFVPSGFEAYARILHPVEELQGGEARLVRWHEVAAWSGLPLHAYARFHSVALPPEPVDGPAPWSGSGPRGGSLSPPDAAVLIDHLRLHTATPERCWFCLWEGAGWYGGLIPDAVEIGPRVRLPHRNHYLYRGPVDAALVGYPGRPPDHTANLWWPNDHAWCVASDVDPSWSYVGGSHALVEALVSEPALEVFEVEPDVPVVRVGAAPWIERWVSDAVEAVVSEGHATIPTSVGTVEAWLEPSPGHGWLRTTRRSAWGNRGSAGHSINTSGDEAVFRDALSANLRWDIVELVGD